jgi:hypothetical protein
MRRKLLLSVPFIMLIGGVVLRLNIDRLMRYGYSCDFYSMTGLWCMGCGNTRAVRAILNGDFIRAFRCNAGFCIGCLLLVALYIQLVTGKKILPTKPLPWVVLCSVLFVYYIARNFVPLLAIPSF